VGGGAGGARAAGRVGAIRFGGSSANGISVLDGACGPVLHVVMGRGKLALGAGEPTPSGLAARRSGARLPRDRESKTRGSTPPALAVRPPRSPQTQKCRAIEGDGRQAQGGSMRFYRFRAERRRSFGGWERGPRAAWAIFVSGGVRRSPRSPPETPRPPERGGAPRPILPRPSDSRKPSAPPRDLAGRIPREPLPTRTGQGSLKLRKARAGEPGELLPPSTERSE
jgi:hypothetical protein